VFTDGYGTTGRRLTAALQKADDEGVEVVGVSIGVDESFVVRSYKIWCRIALPAALPDALRALYSQSSDVVRGNRNPAWDSLRMYAADSVQDLKQIWRERQKAFPNILKELEGERDRELKVQPGNTPGDITVDLCFVTDVTGSMMGAFHVYLQADPFQFLPIIQPMITALNNNLYSAAGIAANVWFKSFLKLLSSNGEDYLNPLAFFNGIF
jgi:hypothetical protein